mmetsp:Transcript_27514/g.82931  ORF Transcript_27514/g.82931 Transcript_27514/m.82931 type:complete len:241 (+) Transcript_27514:3-725(+)
MTNAKEASPGTPGTWAGAAGSPSPPPSLGGLDGIVVVERAALEVPAGRLGALWGLGVGLPAFPYRRGDTRLHRRAPAKAEPPPQGEGLRSGFLCQLEACLWVRDAPREQAPITAADPPFRDKHEAQAAALLQFLGWGDRFWAELCEDALGVGARAADGLPVVHQQGVVAGRVARHTPQEAEAAAVAHRGDEGNVAQDPLIRELLHLPPNVVAEEGLSAAQNQHGALHVLAARVKHLHGGG